MAKKEDNGGWKEERKMLSVAEQGDMRVMQSGRIKWPSDSTVGDITCQLLCTFEAMATIWGKQWQIITRNLSLLKNQLKKNQSAKLSFSFTKKRKL